MVVLNLINWQMSVFFLHVKYKNDVHDGHQYVDASQHEAHGQVGNHARVEMANRTPTESLAIAFGLWSQASRTRMPKSSCSFSKTDSIKGVWATYLKR